MAQINNEKLNKTFNDFMSLAKKRLTHKEQRKNLSGWDSNVDIPTPLITGNAYDKLRGIMLFPEHTEEKEYFDVANLVMLAWYRKTHPKKRGKK